MGVLMALKFKTIAKRLFCICFCQVPWVSPVLVQFYINLLVWRILHVHSTNSGPGFLTRGCPEPRSKRTLSSLAPVEMFFSFPFHWGTCPSRVSALCRDQLQFPISGQPKVVSSVLVSIKTLNFLGLYLYFIPWGLLQLQLTCLLLLCLHVAWTPKGLYFKEKFKVVKTKRYSKLGP